MTKRRRCWSWQGVHSELAPQCTYCERTAVFHWRETYPDVLLCLDCLELFPEATEAAAEREQRRAHAVLAATRSR